METRTRAGFGFSILITLLGVFLAVGSRTLFPACDAKEDGSYMACHWAELAVSAVGVVIAVQGLLAVCIRDRRAQGAVFASVAPTALLACLLPGVVISICSMSGMQCRTVLRPWVILTGAVILVFSLLGALTGLKRKHSDED